MAENKTWMPLTAGILDIICGAWGIFFSIILILLGRVILALVQVPPAVAPIFMAMAIPFGVLSILAIVGGVFALRRKVWGLALAGSIASLFSPYFFILAIASIVMTAFSKNEFE